MNKQLQNRYTLLFAFPLMYGSTAAELYKAFKRIEYLETKNLFSEEYISRLNEYWDKPCLYERLRWKLKIPIDKYGLNKKLPSFVAKNKVDIIFFVKPIEVHPFTLKRIRLISPTTKLIMWSQDDMYAKHNRSIFLDLSWRYYDLIVTQKSFNVNELPLLGAKKVLFQFKAFSKDIHKPIEGNSNCSFKHDVVFIGVYEKERAEAMCYLAENGIEVNIYGPNWNARKFKHRNLKIHNRVLVGEEYAEAISSSRISLCFLNKKNRDLHTSRSIEIPACGGFMLGERTPEHLVLFKEGEEAEFFESKEELLAKVTYYLQNEEKRKLIAQAGRNRCLTSGYSYDDRAREIIEVVLGGN